MKKQLCAALLASSLLTTSLVSAQPLLNQPPLEPIIPISAPVQTHLTATIVLGNADVMLNGKKLDLPYIPYVNVGKDLTMVPLEYLAQFLQTRPSYNPQDDTVTINHQGQQVTFRPRGDEVRLGNGEAKKLPLPTELIDFRTAVPLRAFAELFDIDVQYQDGVITLMHKAHQDYRIGFSAMDGKLHPEFDHSLTPKVFLGRAQDYLSDYPEGEGERTILAISQPGQEMMIQSIEVKIDHVVVHAIPESRWSNAPEGTMGLIHYGPRRVVELLDPLPQGLRVEIHGYELPAKAVVEADEVGFSDFTDSLPIKPDQLKTAGVFGQMVTMDDQEQLVLVATLGQRNTGGYGIEVLWVEKAENKLIVHAKEKTPAPGAAVIMAITYPYETIMVDNAYQDWELELNLVQTVDFTLGEWGPATHYEVGEPGVTKSTTDEGKLLLTVCAGEKPNPGYGLTVERVELQNQLLVVHARVSEPAPGTIWPQVITYPRDVVAVDADYADYRVQLVLH